MFVRAFVDRHKRVFFSRASANITQVFSRFFSDVAMPDFPIERTVSPAQRHFVFVFGFRRAVIRVYQVVRSGFAVFLHVRYFAHCDYIEQPHTYKPIVLE